MNQEKIGKFIAACRKENGYTQAGLADKLGITGRAVSKWETGKSMPDVSIMLELCELLNINVNELLTGEYIIMGEYKEIAEKNLIEMKRKEQRAKKAVVAVVICAIAILLVWFAGQNIGEDIGKFIYYITH